MRVGELAGFCTDPEEAERLMREAVKWGLQQNKPTEDIVEEQSQESEDEELTAAYGAPKERRDSFSDDEDPNRHRDDQELDNFFNFADGAQQDRATNSEYIKKNVEKANDKDLKLQLAQ